MASKTEPDTPGGCITLPGFELDLDRRELRAADGSQAPLRRKALEALLVLAGQAGHVVGKDELVRRVWPDTVVSDDSLTQLINELRRALGDTDRSLVRTVARRGYVLAIARDVPPAAAPPPAGVAEAASNQLPPLTNAMLFGRQADLAAVADLVLQHRLVTIAGAGGIGKTTLALAVTHRLLEHFAKDVWWVDLSVLSDAARVLPAIAAAVGIELKGDARRCLAAELSGREILLVLDNCEHLVAEVAAIVPTLLGSAAGVKVLATSQELLRTDGERLYRLGVLDLPPQGASLAVAMTSPAFQLFAQRATEVDQAFALDATNTPLAVEICRHLDGVPLAIEMAAGRVPTLGVGGVHALLGDRLRVLRNARRMVPSRQETLRATLEWSCSLLGANELAVLRRASAFAGPFDAALAAQVVTQEPADAWGTLDALCSLVDRSLIRVERPEPVRYRLPESTRLLAREMLDAAGEVEAVARSHCRAMARIGLEISAAYYQPCATDDEIVARYAVFYADLERAFEHACRRADADAAAAILVGLRWLDQLRGDTESTQGRIEKCLPLLPSEVCAARARMLGVIASCGWLSIAGFPARDAAAAAVQAWRQLDPEPGTLGHGLLRLAAEEARDGRSAEAQAALAEGEQVLAGVGNPKLQLLVAIYAGHVAMFCGSPAVHFQCMSKALKEARERGASRLARYILSFLPGAALLAGDARQAILLGSEAAHEMRALRQRYYLTTVLVDLVGALVEVGEMDRARFEAVEALPLAWEFEHQADMARHVALMALRMGRPVDGATLVGYAVAQHGEPRNALEARACADCEALRQLATQTLGPSAAAAAHGAGRQLGHDAALALAGAVLGMPNDSTG